MMQSTRGGKRWVKAMLCAAISLSAVYLPTVATPAAAAEFHLYLECGGNIFVKNTTYPAELSLAFRDNNQTVLIQKSNMLPVGERMRYTPTEMTYTMNYHTPQPGSRVLYDWLRGKLFVIYPDLNRVAATRISISRQTGVLEGDYVNAAGQRLAAFRLDCKPTSVDDLPAPKF